MSRIRRLQEVQLSNGILSVTMQRSIRASAFSSRGYVEAAATMQARVFVCRHDWGVRNIHLNLRMTAARANSQQQLSAARTKQVSPRRTAKVSSYTVAPAAQPHEQNESVTADLSRLEEWKLHAAMHAVAAGPDGKTVFLVMVNQAAAEHHLPFFLKSLRNLPVRRCLQL